MATREEVAQALFERLTTRITGLITKERKYVDPTTLQERVPALLLITDNHTARGTIPGTPAVRYSNFILVYYAVPGENDPSPETPLNNFVQALEAALERDPLEPITDPSNPASTNLGGRCKRVSVSGTIEMIPGEIGGISAVIVPLEVLLP